MTLPLPWTVGSGQTGELADTQTAYRLLMPGVELAQAGVLAADTFTRPDASTLDTAETGQSWSVLAGSWAVAAGRATTSTTSTAAVDAARSNVDATVLVTPTSGAAGVVVKSAATDADRLAVQLDLPNNALRLNKTDTSTTTTLVGATVSFTVGQTYTLRVLAVDSSVKAWLDGALLIDYTLSGPETTKYGALTRVGLRSTGTAAFDDLAARIGYPSSSASAPTLANIPAGSVLYAVESAGSYVRPTSRADVCVIFQGASNPGSVALESDIWARTP